MAIAVPELGANILCGRGGQEINRGRPSVIAAKRQRSLNLSSTRTDCRRHLDAVQRAVFGRQGDEVRRISGRAEELQHDRVDRPDLVRLDCASKCAADHRLCPTAPDARVGNRECHAVRRCGCSGRGDNVPIGTLGAFERANSSSDGTGSVPERTRAARRCRSSASTTSRSARSTVAFKVGVPRIPATSAASSLSTSIVVFMASGYPRLASLYIRSPGRLSNAFPQPLPTWREHPAAGSSRAPRRSPT